MALLTGRNAVLSAAGDTPYVRSHTGGEVLGFHQGAVTAWVADGPWGEVGCALGPAEGTAEAIALLRKETGREWWQLAPGVKEAIGLKPLAQRKPWTFAWAPQSPELAGPVDLVEKLASDDGIAEVLAASLPDAGGKPGDPRIHGWYGIFDGATLVACAADKTVGGVGFLSSIAVLPGYQGKGFGSALTTVMARELFAMHGRVALAVEDHNPDALRLYRKLGFTESLQRISYQLTD